MPARNYFAQGGASEIIGAGNDAFDRQTALFDDVNARYTATRAGRRMAQGDRMGASREFANAGLLDEARTLESDQVAADTRMRQDREREAAGMKARDAEQEAAKAAQAEAMLAILKRLQTVPAGQRSATLQRAAPILQSVGMDPTPFLSMPETDLSDEALTVATGEAAKAAEEYTLAPGARRYRGDQMIANNPARPIVMGGGASAFDPESGEVVARNPKTFAPPRAGGGKAAASGPKPTGRRF